MGQRGSCCIHSPGPRSMVVTKHVLVEQDNYITTVTLNRPEAMNAINVALALEIVQVMDEIGRDDQSRVIMMCSSSDRAFSVGADLKERQGLTPDVWQRQRIDLMR